MTSDVNNTYINDATLLFTLLKEVSFLLSLSKITDRIQVDCPRALANKETGWVGTTMKSL